MKTHVLTILLCCVFVIVAHVSEAQGQVKVKIKEPKEQFQQLRHLQLAEQPYLAACVDTHFVLLWWSAIKGAEGYNLYRKAEGGAYTKINVKPITWPTDQNAATKKYDALMPAANFKLERNHILKLSSTAVGKSPGVDVGQLSTPPFTDTKAEVAFRYLGNIYHQIALIIGQAYADSSVKSGNIYYYKIKWLDDKGSETAFGGEVKVQAGVIKQLTKPTGLTAEAGDSKVLLLWNDPPQSDTIVGYHVYRATSSAGPFVRYDSIPVLAKQVINLKGDSLKPSRYGFFDIWVKNYTTYYYKVAPRNPCGRVGPMSDVVSAMPVDLTPPKMPQNIAVTSVNKDTMLLTWKWVSKDIRDSTEAAKGYRIFRYTDYQTAVSDTGTSTKYSIGFVKERRTGAQFWIMGDTLRAFRDGNVETEKVYWYRLSCEDTAGNIGHKTVALSGILPDFEPPDPIQNIQAAGFDNYILISWKPPDMTKKNKDLVGYLIYRGICGGENVLIYRGEKKYEYRPYPLHLLADITDKDTITYKDYSVPKGSPICYRYAIKAYDKSQNLSVMSDSVCERLRDKTPPDQPVITALQARNNAIKIECVAPPIQDIKGFMVERSEDGKTKWDSIYSDPVPKSVSCGEIPVSVDSVLAKKVNYFSFTDKGVTPDKVYWYRVRAFDYNNNRSKPSPPISTYTFEVKKLLKPVQFKASQRECEVTLSWGPDTSQYSRSLLGFVVFRSLDKSQGYRQISNLIKDTDFKDAAVAAGVTYWYKVQAFDSNGDRSPLSDSLSVTIK